MNKIRTLSVWLAFLLAAMAVASDFLSPCLPDALDVSQAFAPPARIHFIDAGGRFHFRPFIYELERLDPLDNLYREKTDRICGLIFMSSGTPFRWLGFIPSKIHWFGAQNGVIPHLWGTDELGRDVFARTLAGTRSSIFLLVFGIGIYFFIGVAVGTIAAAAGGWMDALFMRTSEFVLSIPALYVVLAARSFLPADLDSRISVLLTAAIIAAATWPPLARGVRNLIRQIQASTYIEASRSMGAGAGYLFRRHWFPALRPYAWAQTTAAAPVFILGEVILSFLNVGTQSQGISWGTMLRGLARDPRMLTDFWWNLSPLFFVFLALFCANAISRPMEMGTSSQLT